MLANLTRLSYTPRILTEHWLLQVLSLAQRRERAAALQQRLSVADASNATGGGAAPAGSGAASGAQQRPSGADASGATGGGAVPASSGAASGAGAAAAPAPGEWLTALKPTGTQRRTLAEVNAGSPTYTGALRAALYTVAAIVLRSTDKEPQSRGPRGAASQSTRVPAHASRPL